MKTMKNTIKLIGFIALVAVIGFSMAACNNGGGGGGGGKSSSGGTTTGGTTTSVTLNSVAADGASAQTTTKLTLAFSQAITGLAAADITLSGVTGVTKGTLSVSGSTYTLPITVTRGGTLTVAVAKTGYTIGGSPKTTPIYYYSSSSGSTPVPVTLNSVTANGNSSTTTTALTLTFSQAITGLAAADITITPSGGASVTKGTLSGSGPTYTLPITVTAGGTLTVAVAKTGYTISGSPKTVSIFYYSSTGGGNTAVTFDSVTVSDNSSTNTKQLTLSFNRAITGLTVNDITLSGVNGVKIGVLSGSGPSYTLTIDLNSSSGTGGTLTVAVAKSGYSISPSQRTVTISRSGNQPSNILITTPVLSNGRLGAAYNQPLAATGLVTYWNITSGELPKGLRLTEGTDVISGTPTEAGIFTFTVHAANIDRNAYCQFSMIIVGGETNPNIEMVSISAGTFTMGSPTNEHVNRGSDETQHSVTLTAFRIGKYQVTQDQYKAVIGNNPSNYDYDPAPGETQGKRPVEMVSWYDALVFCNKLSMLQGLTPAYSINGKTDPYDWGPVPVQYSDYNYPPSKAVWDAVTIVAGSTGYRLPTEAQWEYACRAGSTTAYNLGATWSNNWGWVGDNSGFITHEVGKKTANAWGLFDMHGNVDEWCWDWKGTYASGTNPMGPSSGDYRVYRGGSSGSDTWNVRSAFRGGNSVPLSRYRSSGFRVVRPQ